VTDSGLEGNVDTETKAGYIVVYEPVDAQFTASPLEGVAGVTEFTFTDESSGGKGPYTYEWDFGDGGTSTLQSPTHTYANAGAYNVSLTVTDSLPANSDTEGKTAYIVILVNSAPVLDLIGDRSVNANGLLEFTISAIDPDGDSLTYSASSLPEGSSFDAETQVFSWSPDEAGTYEDVHFEVSDGSLSDSEDITITVYGQTTILEAHFNTDTDGFDYIDDPFRGTTNPEYADGSIHPPHRYK